MRALEKRRLPWLALALLGSTLAASLMLGCGAPARQNTATAPAEALPVHDSLPHSDPDILSTYPAPPASPRHPTESPVHGVVVSDPYRWLEPQTDPAVQSWVEAQSTHTRRILDALPHHASLTERFTELLYLDAVSPPIVRGGRYFYTRRLKTKEKALLMERSSAPRPVGARPGSASPGSASQDTAERTLIDPNAISADGSVALGGWFPSWDGKKLAYALRQNNADEATLYVRDVDSGKDSEVDVIDGAKYAGPTWTPDNLGFYYEWLPRDPDVSVADRPGRTELRYHRLGTDPREDTLIFPATLDPKTFLHGGVTRDGRWLFISVQRGWNQNDVYVREARNKPVPVSSLEAPAAAAPTLVSTDARVAAYAKQLGFTPLAVGHDAIFRIDWHDGAFYIRTNLGAPNYRVLKTRTANSRVAEWKEIVPATNDKLDDSSIVGGRLVLNYLRNAASQIEVRSLDGKPMGQVGLPGLGSASGMVGEPDRDEAYFSYSSFTVPSQVYQTSISKGSVELWSEVDLPIDTSKMSVEQVWYNSKDGTRVSMFVVKPKGITLDGSHPTLLYGYGGFNIDMSPSFSSLTAVWLERGGIYAIPNLRGGGEYGEAWHRAGMGKNKQNTFDDFAAAAEHLIAQRYTTEEHLAIYGGSNGGLLVGAAMTQRPELFRAVVCGVPLLDMVRYHLFGSGKTWIAEYGSAEEAEQFATLYAYSPYHHVKQGAAYPALLMMAADSDDRVDPMHARKFTAAVQWAHQDPKRPALFRVEDKAGHGGGDMVKKRVASATDIVAFLLDQLGG